MQLGDELTRLVDDIDPVLLFHARFALAYACVLLGTFPILAGLGVLSSDEPIELIAIPFVILFGMVFVALGAGVVWGPLRTLAVAHGARTWAEAWRLALRRLLARADRESFVAAAWVALLAATYWAVLAGARVAWLGEADVLGAIMTVEFLTIHAFPFMVVAAVFFAAGGRRARAAVVLLLAPFGAGYVVLAWALGGGVAGIVALAYLLVPNVLPFVGQRERSARVLAVSRWCVKFAVLMVAGGTVGGWDVDSLWLGAVYFTVLAVVELWRVAEVPLDLAAEWDGVRARTA